MASQIASNTNVAYIFMILFAFQKARNIDHLIFNYIRFQFSTFVYNIFINVHAVSVYKKR